MFTNDIIKLTGIRAISTIKPVYVYVVTVSQRISLSIPQLIEIAALWGGFMPHFTLYLMKRKLNCISKSGQDFMKAKSNIWITDNCFKLNLILSFHFLSVYR